MYIKQLEIDNFKSFARKVDIPILNGFTTVAGPNGSGKSNIIDSILFALGLATTRTLRAERLSHLISTYTNRNEAKVKVTFSGLENEPDFSVARRLKKASNGQFLSTYYINDSVTTQADVHLLLEKYNITPNSYNVIMQADVTTITTSSSNERRKIIDEIAGVADFDRRIEQATKELDTVEERVEKTNILLTELDARLQELEAEKEVALKYQKLKDEKAVYDGQINAVRFFEIKRNLELAHENILDSGKKKKEEEDKLKDNSEKLKLIQEKFDAVSKEAKEKGEDTQIALVKKAEEIKGKISTKENATTYAEKNIQDNLKIIEGKLSGIEKQKEQIEKHKLNIGLKNDEVDILDKEIAKKEQELTDALKEITGLTETESQYADRRNSLRTKKEELQDQTAKLINEKVPLEKDLNILKENLSKANEELEQAKTFKENIDSEKDKRELEIKNLEKEIEDLKVIQTSYKNEQDTCNNDKDQIMHDLENLYRKIIKLKGEKETRQANSDILLNHIMKCDIKGVHAPIYKLGTVDKEYSTALEAAIGGRMKHIVVENEYVASSVIETAKSSGIKGRVHCAPLNKLKKAPDSLPLPKEKGVIDYAINLIDFNDIYINAFYYAVGDTLIVENESVARKLHGKYRMATLTGEIYEKIGTISGGLTPKSDIRFNVNDDNEIEKEELKYKELQAQGRELEAKINKLTEKLSNTRQEYIDANSALAEAKADFKTFMTQVDANEQKIEESTTFIKTESPNVEKINKKLDKMEEKNIELNRNINDLQAQIDEIDKLMNNDTAKQIREKTANIESDIKSLKNDKTNALNEITGVEQNINFCNVMIESSTGDIARTKQQNEQYEKENQTRKKEIETLNEKLDVLNTDIEEIRKKLNSLLEEKEKIYNEKLGFEKIGRDIQSSIEKIIESIEAFKTRRKELEPQLESAKQVLEENGLKPESLEPTEISIEELQNKIQRLQKKMDDLGNVNMRAIETFEKDSARQKELKEKIETLSTERKQIIERMQGYEQLKKESFMKTYNSLNIYFKESFRELADGDGTLILENPEEPFQGGLTIDAQPRDKKKQRLESMSGGEKSITALAFVFAIQKFSPAPFYALDEVDASLDPINVEKLANLIHNQAKNTQFIVVSHKPSVLNLSDRTIGVTQKEKGITKLTGILQE